MELLFVGKEGVIMKKLFIALLLCLSSISAFAVTTFIPVGGSIWVKVDGKLPAVQYGFYKVKNVKVLNDGEVLSKHAIITFDMYDKGEFVRTLDLEVTEGMKLDGAMIFDYAKPRDMYFKDIWLWKNKIGLDTER